MNQNDDTTQNNKLSSSIDSERDKELLKPEVTEMKLPDVEDIPGQEHVKPAPLGDLADVTASSADEEANELLGDDESAMDEDSNVTDQDRFVLDKAATDMPGDDERLRKAALDSTDDDGTPLNEKSFDKDISADDLDVPGSGLDDDDEAIGEEDEENNEYSLPG